MKERSVCARTYERCRRHQLPRPVQNGKLANPAISPSCEHSMVVGRSPRDQAVLRGHSARQLRSEVEGYTNFVRRGSSQTSNIDTACSDQLRSEEHTSELQSLMRISYAVFRLKKNNKTYKTNNQNSTQI